MFFFSGSLGIVKSWGRGNWTKIEERVAGFGVLRIRIEITIECQKKKEDLRVKREQSFRVMESEER